MSIVPVGDSRPSASNNAVEPALQLVWLVDMTTVDKGEIEQIFLMKPEAQGPHDDGGFLEYLEDINGTKKYVEKIDESSKELESLDEMQSGVVQMVKLAELYMLKELAHLKWQEADTIFAIEESIVRTVELQSNVSSLEEHLKTERERIGESITILKELDSLHNKYMKRQEECIKEQETLASLEQAARLKLNDLKPVMESGKSQGSVFIAIFQAKESNQIDGIYGRRGDLGAIDGFDYIAVETTAAAQACVELLRKKNLGITTFMIMEKQTHFLRNVREKVSPPNCVLPLFDLVRVQDDRMKLAFFAALRNTVVADNIDQMVKSGANIHGTIITVRKFDNGKGVVLASDSMASIDGVPVHYKAQKISMHGSILFGGAGKEHAHNAAFNHLQVLPLDSSFPAVVESMRDFMNLKYPITQVPMIRPSLVLCGCLDGGLISIKAIRRDIVTDLFVVGECQAFTAIGSGARYALPILQRGHSSHTYTEAWEASKSAVLAAMFHNSGQCGGGLMLLVCIIMDSLKSKEMW